MTFLSSRLLVPKGIESVREPGLPYRSFQETVSYNTIKLLSYL